MPKPAVPGPKPTSPAPSARAAQERNPALEQRLRDDIAAAGKAIEAIDTELARRFPEYHELARLQPVSVNEVRALLKPGEAMLAYALAGDTAYLWVVTKDGAQFLPLKAKAADIKANLSKVRGQMEFSPEGNAPRVSVEILHELHQALIAPALPHLGGISHLLIVPDGALQSLPFGMLVASPPPAIAGDADYRQVDWLARHYAMSVLPSVGSIKALRQFAKARRGEGAVCRLRRPAGRRGGWRQPRQAGQGGYRHGVPRKQGTGRVPVNRCRRWKLPMSRRSARRRACPRRPMNCARSARR